MRNYIRYGKTTFNKWQMYAYLDLPENFAASVLHKNDVRYRFDRLMTREDTKYVLIQMLVKTEDKEKFLKAMEDLKTKMLLCGHPDYETEAGELIRELENNLIEEALQDEKLMKKLGLADKNIIIVDG